MTPVDGGDGMATVDVSAKEKEMLTTAAQRSMSDPSRDPVTGAERRWPGRRRKCRKRESGAPGQPDERPAPQVTY